MFADELPADEDNHEPTHHHRRAWAWVAALLAVALLAGGGVWVLTHRGNASDRRIDRAAHRPSAHHPNAGRAPTDVAVHASASAPTTAPPNRDVDGNPVSYDASNMLDGVPATAWRTPGDATGMRLTFRLAEPTRLRRVGLVNGYAKTSTDGAGRAFDWYAGDRRLLAVRWILGHGRTLRQTFQDDPSIQTVAVRPVLTSRVVLRIVEVSPPGSGRTGRDYTAISEVSLVGTPVSH